MPIIAIIGGPRDGDVYLDDEDYRRAGETWIYTNETVSRTQHRYEFAAGRWLYRGVERPAVEWLGGDDPCVGI